MGISECNGAINSSKKVLWIAIVIGFILIWDESRIRNFGVIIYWHCPKNRHKGGITSIIWKKQILIPGQPQLYAKNINK